MEDITYDLGSLLQDSTTWLCQQRSDSKLFYLANQPVEDVNKYITESIHRAAEEAMGLKKQGRTRICSGMRK